MKILLDTNVWNYVADENAGDDLRRVARDANVEVAVAPGTVDEVKVLPNEPARRRALPLITDPQWTRLLPEAYSESEELKLEIRRLRPEWINLNPDLLEVERLYADWVSPAGGFWDRARAEAPLTETDESVRAETEHRLARKDSYQFRRNHSTRPQDGGKSHLQRIATVPPSNTPGWEGEPVDYWRVPSLLVFRNELSVYASPYREWLDSEIDIQKMLTSMCRLTDSGYMNCGRKVHRDNGFEERSNFSKCGIKLPMEHLTTLGWPRT